MVSQVDRVLGVVGCLDRHIGPIKSRRRGLSAGEMTVALCETILAGGDFLADLDHQRKDVAGAGLRTVGAVPAATTVIGVAKHFDEAIFARIETAVGELVARAFAALPEAARAKLIASRPTIDLDPTDVETYGKHKQGMAWNHAGQWCGRPHPAMWAEAGWALAASYGSGRDDPRPQAPSLMGRAVANLPGGLGPAIFRADSGFFDAKVAHRAIELGADFAICAKRNQAAWRAVRDVPAERWCPAQGMDAEVAECAYAPASWPAGTRCVVRRVPLSRQGLRSDPRSRRRRTIDPNQLVLLEAGEIATAYSYTFILTSLAWDPVSIEAWFRQRALVEERIKDSKWGMALRHLPSGYEPVNTLWMWAAFLALNISAWTQSLAGLDHHGRAHGKRLRRELICVPARVVRHARQLIVRPAPEHRHGPFADAWETLCSIPSRNHRT